ncbi:MAG: SpoIID/LytB domain-containing protein [Deltaproteobacteria bacterium]|nr:SpoIID/LytB domain-containing protein [Deltaproteobacteria bacterium]
MSIFKTAVFLAVILPFAASAKHLKTEEPEKIRVLVATSVSKPEALQLTADKNGTINFRGKKYTGELQFFDDGRKTLTAVNVLPLEEYLIGLVASEMPKDWPLEALKAQAVIARTYALYQKKIRSSKQSSSFYDVESGVQDQVYLGIANHDSRVKGAVESTKGEIVSYKGQVFKSFFSSTCGGMTESAVNVWGEKGLFALIKDPYCARSPYSAWKYSLSRRELAARLSTGGFQAETIKGMTVEHRKNNPRVATLEIDAGGKKFFIQGSDFRKIVGFKDIKSTWFDVKINGGQIEFEGRGYGHGVGLCQWGAYGMADAGKSYHEILKYYYPGVKITNPHHYEVIGF